MKKIIPPHHNKSREVTNADMFRIIEDCASMQAIVGGECIALAHAQIEDKDPLRFFVTKNGEVIINPKITRHVNYTVDSLEGCMTFPENKKGVTVQRWRKIDVEFQTIINGELSEILTEQFVGLQSFMFQHEIDHFDGKYCYEEHNKDMQGTNLQS